MVYDWGMVDSPDVRVVLDELTAVRQRFDRLAGDAYSLGQSLGNIERRLWGDPHEQAVLAELLHEIRRRFGSPGRMLDEREMRELSTFLFEYLAGVPRQDPVAMLPDGTTSVAAAGGGVPGTVNVIPLLHGPLPDEAHRHDDLEHRRHRPKVPET